jgi:hypothetical protein
MIIHHDEAVWFHTTQHEVAMHAEMAAETSQGRNACAVATWDPGVGWEHADT